MGLIEYIKETIRLNREYYESFSEEQNTDFSAKEMNSQKPAPPKTEKKESEYWPYDNNINISNLSRAEQHERELKIQMYMEAYPFLPFLISDSFLYRPNTAWTSLNKGEQAVVLDSLKELNDLVVDFKKNDNVIHELLPLDIHIPYERVCFDEPRTVGNTPRSFIEYRPLTNSGNRRKDPLIVHFTTIKDSPRPFEYECAGELVYGLDGSVVSAEANIFKNNKCYSYSFGLVGRTFTIAKITTPGEKPGTKAIIYSSLWDFMEY